MAAMHPVTNDIQTKAYIKDRGALRGPAYGDRVVAEKETGNRKPGTEAGAGSGKDSEVFETSTRRVRRYA